MQADFMIYVMGDPMIDTYHFGHLYTTKEPSRFITEFKEQFRGGASNVSRNIHHLLGNTDTFTIRCQSLFDQDQDYWVELNKLVDLTAGTVPGFEIADKELTDQKIYPRWENSLTDAIHWITSGRKGLVLADYNRGYCNQPIKQEHQAILNTKGKFDFIIVDSRHGTLHRDWLKYGKRLVLHVTGKEAEKHDFEDYGYIYHTDGPNPVKIYWGSDLINTIEVPKTTVVDTCGAGDTFVASLAVHLAKNRNIAWNDALMIEAGKFAIENCQHVIQCIGTATIATPKSTKE